MGAALQLSFDGLDQVLAKIDAVAAALPGAVTQAVSDFGSDLMAASQELVPERFGDLAASGFVDSPEISGTAVSVTLGYRSPYAIYVHEALEGAQPPSPNWSWTKHVAAGGEIHWTKPGSGPKYLERPAIQMEPDFLPRVAASVNGVIG